MKKRDYFVRHLYPVPKCALALKRQATEELTKTEAAAALVPWSVSEDASVREIDLPLPPHEQQQVDAFLAAKDCRHPERRRWKSYTVRPRMRGMSPRPQGEQNLARRIVPDTHEIVRDRVRRKLREMPYLSREEEAALIEAAKAGDIKARDRVVLAHMRMVMRLARGTWKNDGVELDDKISAGALGLLDGFGTFEPKRNVPFGSHAKWPVKNAIRDHALSEVSPVRERRPQGKRLQFGRVSLDAPVYDRQGGEEKIGTLIDTLGAPATRAEEGWEGYHALDSRAWASAAPFEAMLDSAEQAALPHRRRLLKSAVQSLPERERSVFQARRLTDDPPKLADLARVYGVSVERVRQIEAKAAAKVERLMKAEIATAQAKLKAEMRQRLAGYRATRICASTPRQSDIPRSPAAWHAPDVTDPRKHDGSAPRPRFSSVPPAPKGQKLTLAAPLRAIARMRVDAEMRRISGAGRRDPFLDRLGIRSLNLSMLCEPPPLIAAAGELLAA